MIYDNCLIQAPDGQPLSRYRKNGLIGILKWEFRNRDLNII
jgi:hypothetical protein